MTNFKECINATRKRCAGDVVASASAANFQIAMEQWSGEHRVFAFVAYISSCFSLSEARRQINNHYGIRRLRDVP